MAKTPTYTADSIKELVSRVQSGEIPPSYAIQGVGTGGPITARSKTALGKEGKARFEEEQRRHTQNKSIQSDLAKKTKQDAANQLATIVEADKKAKKEQDVQDQVNADEFKRMFELRTGTGKSKLADVTLSGDEQLANAGIKDLGKKIQKQQEQNAKNNKAAPNQPPPPTAPPVDTKPIPGADPTKPGFVGSDYSAAPLSDLDKLNNELAKTKVKADTLNQQLDSGTPNQSVLDALAKKPGGVMDFFGDVATGSLDVLSRGVDIISRPGYSVNAGITAFGNPDESMGDVLAAMGRGLTGQEKPGWASVMQEAVAQGHDEKGQPTRWNPETKTMEPVNIKGPLAVATGFAGDVLADPTTYVGLGTIAKGATGIAKGTAARAAIDVETQASKAGLKAATIQTASKKGLTEAQRASTRAKADYIKAGGVIGQNPTEDLQIFDHVMKNTGDMVGAQAAVQQAALARAGRQVEQTTAERLAKENERALQIKFLGAPVGQKYVSAASSGIKKAVKSTTKIPLVGKKLDSAEKQLGYLLNKGFNTRYYFPGKTHDLEKIAQEQGIVAHKTFTHQVQDMFKGTSKADRIRVADAIESGQSLAGQLAKNGKDLGDLQDFFKLHRDKFFNEDKNLLGKYIDGDHSDNFVFHFYRAGQPFKKPRDITAWKRARREALRANDQGAIARHSLAEAEKSGFKPMRGADEILIAHSGDHSRRLVRDDFLRRVVENYGMVTDNAVAAHTLGLERYSSKSLRHRPIPGMRLAKDQNLYVRPEVKDVIDRTLKMFSTSDDSIRGALRGYDQALRHWKFFNTAANPAHHVRNSISDFFMNYMDGVVNPYRYRQSAQMLNSGKRAGLKFNIGGKTLTGDEVWNLYRRSGSAQGFIASELKEGATKIHRGIYNFAEHREEWTRLAHFLDIMQKETKHLTPGNTAGLWKKVRDAGRRVNKWNIDYSDLTPFERNTMKRIIPFYTFYRKALPLMMESLATKPGRLLAVPKGGRAIENMLGVPPMDQDKTHYPDWLNQLGFARLSGGTNPRVWSPGIPTQLPGDFLQGGDVAGITRNVLGMTTPALKFPIELATGRSLTTGGAADTSAGQFANTQLQDTISAGLGLSGLHESGDAYKNDTTWQLNKLLGLGVYKISDKQQQSEIRRQEQEIRSNISKWNQQLGPYEVHEIKDGYRVYDPDAKAGLKDFTGPNAIADAYKYGILLARTLKK